MYAMAVLAALLTLGKLSDHVGRRPVLLTAIAVHAGSLVIFATATGVPALLSARVVQGLSTGAALGAIGVAMRDMDRELGTVRRAAARTVMLSGIIALITGVAVTVMAVSLGSAAIFFAGSAIAGAGFGSGFQGGIRLVVPLAAAHERAGLVSLLYVVSYLGWACLPCWPGSASCTAAGSPRGWTTTPPQPPQPAPPRPPCSTRPWPAERRPGPAGDLAGEMVEQGGQLLVQFPVDPVRRQPASASHAR